MRAYLFFLITILGASSVYAVRPIPRLTGPVMDEAALLSTSERSDLSELIRSFVPKIQMQIWVVKNLDGEAIESLSIRAVDQWKLGTDKSDNGILILVALEDRQMRIEVGQGLEGDIPDALAGRVIDQILRPAFRSEQYFEGLQSAATFLQLKATGQTVEEPNAKDPAVPSLLKLFLMFIVILFWIIGSLSRRRGFGGGAMGGGFGGGWGSGGLGGGGWSGGGGGFSGGGSSGRW